MMRQLTLFMACLWTGTLLGQAAVVNTRLFPAQAFNLEGAIALDLGDYFQAYPEPGPVATFIIDMPLLADPDNPVKDFKIAVGEDTVPLVVYRLKEGLSFPDAQFPDNPYDPFGPSGNDFEWGQFDVAFQLLADQAPVTVANFITYTRDGAYEKTVVHRNESTGGVYREGGYFPFNPLHIIQLGGFRLKEGGNPPMEWIPTRSPIAFEETIPNTTGTLAMARAAAFDSAGSQFFINLEDNSPFFRSNYSVFGELLSQEEDHPVLKQFATAPIYDLSTAWSTGKPNFFPSLPFVTIPMYTPKVTDPSSYARITRIEIPEGERGGITYSHEWAEVDFGDLEGEELEEAKAEVEANRAVFHIAIEERALTITRSDSGTGVLIMKAEDAAGNTAAFRMNLVGYNPEAIIQFPVSSIYQGGWLDNIWYEWMYAENFPIIQHLNHGYQYIVSAATANAIYAYDYKLQSWLYTSQTVYPYFYSFELGRWVYFNSAWGGNGFDQKRWFYVFDPEGPYYLTDEGDIVPVEEPAE